MTIARLVGDPGSAANPVKIDGLLIVGGLEALRRADYETNVLLLGGAKEGLASWCMLGGGW